MVSFLLLSSGVSYAYKFSQLNEAFKTDCWSCRIFSSFYDIVAMQGYGIYYYLTKYIIVFLYFAMSAWIIWYIYKNVILASLQQWDNGGAQLNFEDFWKNLFKKMVKIAIVGAVFLSVQSFGPQKFMRYTLDPIVEFGLGAAKWVVYSQGFEIAEKINSKAKNDGGFRFTEKIVPPEYCLVGDYSDVKDYPKNRALLNTDVKMDYMCLVKGFDALSARFGMLNFKASELGSFPKFISYEYTIGFWAIAIISILFIVLSIMNYEIISAFTTLCIGGIVLFVYLFLFSSFSIMFLGYVYLFLGEILKILTSFFVISGFIGVAFMFALLPLYAATWVFEDDGFSDIFSSGILRGLFGKIISIATGFFGLALAFLIVIVFNEVAMLSLGGATEVLENDLASVGVESLLEPRNLMTFLIHIVSMVIAILILKDHRKIAGFFGSGNYDSKPLDTMVTWGKKLLGKVKTGATSTKEILKETKVGKELISTTGKGFKGLFRKIIGRR